MMDSLQQTDGLIKATTQASASSNTHSQELLSLSLTLEDLMDLRRKLYGRIQNATQILFGRDTATAAAVQRAIKNEFLMKRMKAHAIRLKIRHQVRDVLLMSVSIKRRTSREKKGAAVYLYGCSAPIWLILRVLLLDAKIRQQTDNAILRKTPGIKALARRYNAMCQELVSHPSKRHYPNTSIPPLIDILGLFNPDANSLMWMDSSLNDEDEAHAPPNTWPIQRCKRGYLAGSGYKDARRKNHISLGRWMACFAGCLTKLKQLSKP